MIKTTTKHVGRQISTRYEYDFGLCSRKGDWAQMDTGQDAPWFGRWANPFKRLILCYAEGDQTLIECDTDTEFTAELDQIAAFHENNDTWKGIDTWSVRIRDRFTAAGSGHLVHAACSRMVETAKSATPQDGETPTRETPATACNAPA